MGINFFNKPKTIGFYFTSLIILVIVGVLLFSLFTWAKPMSVNDNEDVKELKLLLQKDSSKIEIISIGDIGTYKNTNYQLVEYTITKDDIVTTKKVMVEVEKKFFNYKCKGILEP